MHSFYPWKKIFFVFFHLRSSSMFRIKDTTDNNHLNSFYGRTSRKTNLWAKQIRKKRPGLFADCFLLFSFSLYHCDEERLLPMTVNLLMTALWSSSSSSYSSSSYYFIIIKKPCSIASAISFVLNAEHSNESPLIEVSFG